jgi:20S proteasome subunit beta 7
MDYFPGNWGKSRARDNETFESSDWSPGAASFGSGQKEAPISHTQQPIVTGTSVLGIKYKDGVMLASDTLASYGSLAQIRDIERLVKVGEYTVVGASGDMSDFQYISHTLEGLVIDEYQQNDGHSLSPKHIYEVLCRIMYGRRSKVNPLWNSLIVGGVKDGSSYIIFFKNRFLGFVDLQGTCYESSTIASGYGAYIAQPLLRKAVEGKEATLTEQEATALLNDCLRVLYYRDARSLNRVR